MWLMALLAIVSEILSVVFARAVTELRPAVCAVAAGAITFASFFAMVLVVESPNTIASCTVVALVSSAANYLTMRVLRDRKMRVPRAHSGRKTRRAAAQKKSSRRQTRTPVDEV